MALSLLMTVLLIGLVSATPLSRVDSKSAIVGGFETTVEDNPWQISLRRYNSHYCGGSIISDKWVLTAAHCTRGALSEYAVRVGSSYKSKDGTTVQIKQIYGHKDYEASTTDYDFSLLELAEPLKLGGNVNTIALPAADLKIEDGTNSLVSGWGNTQNSSESSEQLRGAYVPIANQEYCVKQYSGRVTDRMICAGYEAGGKDSCQGDSGGPLSILVKDVPTVVGVVSWGRGCAQPQYPGVYARVTSVRAWIKEVSGL